MAVTFVAGVGPPRVAYGVGRAVGPAVQRNKIKRRLRAVVRDLEGEGGLAPGPGAYLVSVRPEGRDLSYGELREKVAVAMDRLAQG